MAKTKIALNPKHAERLSWVVRSCAQLTTFAAETERLELSTQLSLFGEDSARLGIGSSGRRA